MKRIFHTWDNWECYPAGFYEDAPKDMTQEEGEEAYRDFLADLPKFEAALKGVLATWHHSCEHYLSNERMNRIAWLGQAAVAFSLGIPSCCRGGYNRLTDAQKALADCLALRYLNVWLKSYGEPEATDETARSRTVMDLY